MPNTRPNIRKINTWLDNVGSQMDQLYRSTYYSNNSNIKDLDNIATDIEDSINSIINRNNNVDVSGISKMYSRLKLRDSLSDSKLADNVKELFESNPITNEVLANYVGNKWIRDLDNEIDTVLKYCTKMQDALDLIRDAVLSSDSYSKDFLNFKCTKANTIEASVFDQRMSTVVEKYDLNTKLREWYMETSAHGEQFVYIVPYKKAISKLLNQKKNTKTTDINYGYQYTTEVTESGVIKKIEMNEVNPTTLKDKDSGFIVEFDMSRTLKSSIEDFDKSQKIVERGTSSLYEEFISEAKNDAGYKKKKLDKYVPDELEIPDHDDNGPFKTTDGLITRTGEEVKPNDLKIKGCVVKTLKRECILPLYVDDDTCLGYYYFEFNKDLGFDFYSNMTDRYGDGYVTQGIEPISKVTHDALNDEKINDLVRHIAHKISVEIDKKFVNANQDLTKEIYAILKYNDVYNSRAYLQHMRVSFLPEEDVHRLVFNIDPKTHRGISDCHKGLIPAKLFACLYITNVTGILTRGQDKRVYYVKQTVESNISQTLLNVINQIKKSNFGIRQIQNLNNILNITGRFNDYVIPVGQSGDSPIQFEVMPGQQFEINNDLYNMLEEMAVNSTGVPIELVQARNSPEFATQFTSSNIKIARTVFARQAIVELFMNKVCTKIYNCEYDDNNSVETELPPPMILNITNTSQMISSAKDYVAQIADYEYEGNTSETADQEKAIFIRRMMRSMLASYVRVSSVDRFKEEAKIEAQREKPTNT